MTQEDILLFPCAEWVYLECSRLLQIKFVEPPLDYITYHTMIFVQILVFKT